MSKSEAPECFELPEDLDVGARVEEDFQACGEFAGHGAVHSYV